MAEVKPKKTTFYMVARDGGGPPLKKYSSFEQAVRDARTLAAKNPGAAFYVVMKVYTAKVKP